MFIQVFYLQLLYVEITLTYQLGSCKRNLKLEKGTGTFTQLRAFSR